MVCLGLEPVLQDGRRRLNHGAMSATQFDGIIIQAFLSTYVNLRNPDIGRSY